MQVQKLLKFSLIPFCCLVPKAYPTLCNLMKWARQASLSFTNFQSLLWFMSIELVTLPNDLILCCPLLLLPSIFPSIRVFSNESALCIRWPKHWNFRILLPMNVHGWFPLGLTGLISLLSKGFSWVFPSTTIRKHQFLGAQPSLCSGGWKSKTKVLPGWFLLRLLSLPCRWLSSHCVLTLSSFFCSQTPLVSLPCLMRVLDLLD